MAVPVELIESLAATLSALLPHLDERQRRLYLGRGPDRLRVGLLRWLPTTYATRLPTRPAKIGELA